MFNFLGTTPSRLQRILLGFAVGGQGTAIPFLEDRFDPELKSLKPGWPAEPNRTSLLPPVTDWISGHVSHCIGTSGSRHRALNANAESVGLPEPVRSTSDPIPCCGV